MNCGVYAITNTLNGNKYIGSSVNISKRWNQHTRHLNKNEHHSGYLQRAWNKYGADNFLFSVLEYCEADFLLTCEQFYIDSEYPEYNMSPTAGNCLGVKHTDEARHNMSESKKGNTICLGHKLTEEHKRKIGEAQIGKFISDETRTKISESKKGKRRSDETRRKVSAAMKGNTNMLGYKHTDESRAKMSDSAKRRCAQMQPQFEVA